MIQGTTPTHTFNLPFSANTIEELRLTYEQKGKIVLSKDFSECSASGNSVVLKLTQEETLLFDSNVMARVQLHIRTTGGDAISHKPIDVPVYILLDRREV